MRISGRMAAAVVAAGLASGPAGSPPAGADPGVGERVDTVAAAKSWQRAGEWHVGRRGQVITGIALDPDGHLVAASSTRRVRTFDRSGDVLSTFLAPIAPGYLDVDTNGDVHLMPNEVKTGAVRSMRVLGPRGRLERTYGRGELPGYGGFEVGDARKRLVFADQVGIKVRVYDVASGRELDSWGRDGTEGSSDPRALDFPGDLALMPDDRLVLADSSRGVLKVFTVGGRHVRTFGARQFDLGVERVAYGGGRAFGVEGFTSQVEVFDTADGRHLRTLRTGLRRVHDVAATPDGNVLYVAGVLQDREPGIVRFVRR